MNPRTPEPIADSGPILDTPAPRQGDRVGSYRLVRLIGEGATGRVYEVEHLTIGRRAAMKMIAPEAAARPGAVKRLFSEAQAVNKISHPHIVEVTDLVEADRPGGVNAIVMELLEGQSLAQAMQQGPMPPERFLPILSQVADALAAAHAARFVHRDLKPDNVFLTTLNGQPDYVKLLDFGLAKTIRETLTSIETSAVQAITPPLSADGPVRGRRTHLTAEGTFVGTPAYASPEQAAGKPIDHRTDIYSLGVILYELLCGRLPFDGRNFGEYLVKHLTQPPPPAPAEVLRTARGRTLDLVARRCLAKTPAERFDSAAELKDIFDRLGRGESSVPGLRAPLSLRATALLHGPPRRIAIASALAGGAALALLVLWPARSGRKSAARAPAAAPARKPDVVPLIPEKTVVVRFESDPPGAETRQVGSDELLGLTPFRKVESAAGAEVEYEMRLPGHTPLRQKVTLSPDVPVVLVGGKLRKQSTGARAAARKREAPPAAARKASRNATLNPFSR